MATTPFETFLLAYIASHPDLMARYRDELDGDLTAALEDFFANGESRGITFDPIGYLIGSPDVLRRVGNDTNAAVRHYIKVGFAKFGTGNGTVATETLADHDAIRLDTPAYLFRLAHYVPQLAMFIANAPRGAMTPVAAAELTRSVLKTDPTVAPQILECLAPTRAG